MNQAVGKPALQIVRAFEHLVTGRQESRKRLSAQRAGGTRDWLLIFNEGGRSYFRNGGKEWTAGRNDLVLIPPDIPHDYGLLESHGYWKNTWVHFLPRPECLDWLKWPEIFPGLMHLRPENSLAREILKTMILIDRTLHGAAFRRQEIGLNLLERVLLMCDSINPLHRKRIDVRVSRAADLLCHNIAEPFHLESLARRCGLSRSRLAQLFRQQMGITPLAFLEQQRLRRVRESLQLTTMGLAQIAEQTGFTSPYYLSLRFKKAYGCSPRKYRQHCWSREASAQ